MLLPVRSAFGGHLGVTSEITSGASGGVSSEIVAVALRPAITPAAGKTESFKLCFRTVSAKAWFPEACW